MWSVIPFHFWHDNIVNGLWKSYRCCTTCSHSYYHCLHSCALYRFTTALLWSWPSYNQRPEGPFPCWNDRRPTTAADRLYGRFKHELTDNKTLRWISVLHKRNTVAWLTLLLNTVQFWCQWQLPIAMSEICSVSKCTFSYMFIKRLHT